MDLDPHKQYQKQLEYEAYIKSQMKNHINLAQYVDNPNDSVKIFAEILFSRSEKNLPYEKPGLLMDEGTETVDIFCVLLELFLYGHDVLVDSKSTVFDLTGFDDLVDRINIYFRSMGFKIKLEENWEDVNINLYRDRFDYYCQITSKPPEFLMGTNSWYVLDYRLLLNRKFVFGAQTPLNTFQAFYVNKEKRIFLISFELV
jgi:hypothetical protein